MKAGIIGAGREALHTIQKAAEYKVRVLALDGNEKAQGLQAADEAKVVDISKEEETIKSLEKENVDFILTAPIGRYLTTVGAANDALGLVGIGKEQAEYCTDKLIFHKKMEEKGLRRCFCHEVRADKSQADKLYEQLESKKIPLSFPAILKPRFGSGSRGIFFIDNMEQLKNSLRECGGEDYILEECIQGEEYGLDGAVINKKFYLVLLRHKINTPPPARQAVAYFSVPREDGFYQEVKAFMEKAVEAMGLDECLLHGDIIRQDRQLLQKDRSEQREELLQGDFTGQKKWPFPVEISARPSGHNLHNLFTPLCTGIDVAEQYIRRRIGLPCNFEPDYVRTMMIHYFDLEGRVTYVPSREELEEKLDIRFQGWQCNIEKGHNLPPVSDGHSLMGRGYFILEGGSEKELMEAAQKVKNMFRLNSSI